MDKEDGAGDMTDSHGATVSCQPKNYFASYEDLSVHELMLKDFPRTQAYKKFFEENAAHFKDKVVLDVGAGTGVLSLFAASVGAKKVYAVEASKMSEICKEIVKCNGFEDKVEVFNCPVEELALPENTKVDVLVSEWMGFYLLHEAMLDSVIYARDKFLASNGTMAPSKATLYVAPTDIDSYHSSHVEYWNNVYGFDFSSVIPLVTQKFQKEPVITEVQSTELLASAQKVVELDLKTVTLADVQKISQKLDIKMDKSGILRGFASWFDVEFSPLDSSVACGVLSTSPDSPQTHWKQTVFMLPEEIPIDTGDEISTLVELSQDEGNKRHYNISIELLDVEDDYSDENDHPVPCDCGATRCLLIKKLMDTYDEEHRELEAEADSVNVEAETEAVRVMNTEMSLESSDLEIIDQ
ncbi:protein arginine N-methyltransferase 1-like [Haliotis rufescens]|uniref:protein arginine N-methyltransferase 1-like n=1 Tax=Haliotis rufescens TaxID=6454 RepID=UPI001EAFCCC0|nr:protein arginine N-methyltransferase 1-like [Haliotis rufescens]